MAYSTVLGGVLTVSYAIRALTESALAATVGRPVEKVAEDGTVTTEIAPPSVGLVLETFAAELTVPAQAMVVSVTEVCNSVGEIGSRSWDAASRLLKSKPAPLAQPAPEAAIAPTDVAVVVVSDAAIETALADAA